MLLTISISSPIHSVNSKLLTQQKISPAGGVGKQLEEALSDALVTCTAQPHTADLQPKTCWQKQMLKSRVTLFHYIHYDFWEYVTLRKDFIWERGREIREREIWRCEKGINQVNSKQRKTRYPNLSKILHQLSWNKKGAGDG